MKLFSPLHVRCHDGGWRKMRRLVGALLLFSATPGAAVASEPQLVEPVPARLVSPVFSPEPNDAIGPTGTIASHDLTGLVAQAVAAEEAANQFAEDESERCVDCYFQAALLAWRYLETTDLDFACDAEQPVALGTYQRSLRGLIESGQHYRRLKPGGSLNVVLDGTQHVVPIEYRGFAWRPCDFSELLAAELYQSDELHQHFRTSGIGSALVGVRATAVEERFFRQRQPFAVTAVLRSSSPETDGAIQATAERGSLAVLELHNSRVISSLRVGCREAQLERDLTAPFSYLREQMPRQYLQAFREPTETELRPKLVLLEPYQRGKIPLLFIHGLLSDPMAWGNLVNALMAQPDIYARYQIWAFRYPTGGALLESTADLRATLTELRSLCDPEFTDCDFDKMVVVGHSMGGLVAKMLVVDSHDILWSRYATKPITEVRAPENILYRLDRSFFFCPVPFVRQVVYIGTPHHGSGLTRRLVGRVGSSLVRYGSNPEYREILEMNPDLLQPGVRRARPTSIDMLEPDSPLLSGLDKTPVSPRVQLHNVIGVGVDSLSGPGDGVVLASSARQPGVASEVFIPARHSELHDDPKTIAEILRILRGN